MNLVLFEPAELSGAGELHLEGRRARHLIEVLGVAPGREVRVGQVRGPVGVATVEEVVAAAPSVRLRVLLEAAASPVPAVTLILAVPRPKALRRVVETATAMGVAAIELVNAWRVERSYWSSPVLAPEALREAAVTGCEQGAHTHVPEIRLHRFLMPFLRELPPPVEARLVAHPRNAVPIERHGAAPRVLAAIGPEGGWIDAELGSLEECGFQPVTLGSSVLRVEAAVPAMLAQLELLRRSSSRS